MKKRLKYKCWNCNRNYTLFKEITEDQTLIVACPFCSREAVVELAPFKKKKKTVMKGDDEQSIGFEYDFPEVIPTEEPEK